MYRHYTAVRSVPSKFRAIEKFSHKGESVKRGSTVYIFITGAGRHHTVMFYVILNTRTM